MEHQPRIRLPKEAKKGEVIEVKTIIEHKMESGQRKDKNGKTIPREIINKFVCKLNGKDVFSVDLQPAISANPFISFFMRATESGRVDFEWHDDSGAIYKTSSNLTVT